MNVHNQDFLFNYTNTHLCFLKRVVTITFNYIYFISIIVTKDEGNHFKRFLLRPLVDAFITSTSLENMQSPYIDYSHA